MVSRFRAFPKMALKQAEGGAGGTEQDRTHTIRSCRGESGDIILQGWGSDHQGEDMEALVTHHWAASPVWKRRLKQSAINHKS